MLSPLPCALCMLSRSIAHLQVAAAVPALAQLAEAQRRVVKNQVTLQPWPHYTVGAMPNLGSCCYWQDETPQSLLTANLDKDLLHMDAQSAQLLLCSLPKSCSQTPQECPNDALISTSQA